MDDNMMERQIADYMVEHGTKNTDSGLWYLKWTNLQRGLVSKRSGFKNTMTGLCRGYTLEKKL